MCKLSPKSVIYLSFLQWRHQESHPGCCTESSSKPPSRLSYSYIIPMFACLFVQILPAPSSPTTSLSLSLGWCPDCMTEGSGSGPRALFKLAQTISWQTSNCHLVSCVCCLESLFWVRLISQHMLKIDSSSGAEWDFQIMILSIFFLSTYM